MMFLKPRTTPVEKEIKEASRHLHELFSGRNQENYREAIQNELAAQDFSGWVSCFIHRIFDYVYTESESQIAIFLTAIGKAEAQGHVLDLITLRQRAVVQYGDITTQMMKLQDAQKALAQMSFTSLQTAVDRSKKLTFEITSLQHSMQPTLDLFRIVEKIIILVIQGNNITSEVMASIKQKMLDNPAEFSAALLPILKLLETGEAKDLDQVISLTLKLVKIDSQDLVPTLAKALVQQKYIKLVEFPDFSVGLRKTAEPRTRLPTVLSRAVIPPITTKKQPSFFGSSVASASRIEADLNVGIEKRSSCSLSTHDVLPPILDTPPMSPIKMSPILTSPPRKSPALLQREKYWGVAIPDTIAEDDAESNSSCSL